MPRPSLKAERRAEILDAYGRCVARHGVEGATLEKTAEEAGLARALIRHNVGNKDDLLEAFLDRFLGSATEATDTLFESLPRDDRVATMIKWLFDPQYTDVQEVSVTNALFTAAIDRPDLAVRLRDWTSEFVAKVGSELKDACPDADDDTIDAAATGISAIFFNFDAMIPLGGMSRLRRSSETAAKLLVSALDQLRHAPSAL